ncbi:tyrosine-type recombinase/integrase [Microbacterium mangrovi]|uniref:tyrosine-type recombinase/integrase n=1 Tax=Microbacterium mangrovi TaxID=1348253 RepID=UPI001E2B47D0|nr:site-specific integrase [Microbacterium mangrovi]
MDDWIADLSKRRKPQTVRRAVFVLSSILAIAQRDGIIASLPTKDLQLPAKVKKPHRYLTHAQVATFVEAIESQNQLIAEHLAYTGHRWGEAVALRVRHMNFLRKRIRVEENAVLVSGTYEFGTPKSGHGRDTPMPPHLVTAYARACEGKSPDDFVFGDGKIPVPYPHASSGWFVHAVKDVQLVDPVFPRITPHDLRHTAASLAISAGANVKAVQRMLGHASAAMTLDVYAELFDDDLDAVAAAMSRAREDATA